MKKIKLRYYLRGLGIGVLVTAIILGIANRGNETMTDAEIRERALELGMVYEDSMVLSDLRGSDSKESEQLVTESDSKVLEESVDGTEHENGLLTEQESQTPEEDTVETEEQSTEEQTTEEQPTEEQTPEEQPTEEQLTEEHSTEALPPEESVVTLEESEEESGIVTIRIYAGASSYRVSKELEAAGLVEDALSFDKYLCDNGYSRVIHVGTHKIEMGTSEEEIAKIITGKR